MGCKLLHFFVGPNLPILGPTNISVLAIFFGVNLKCLIRKGSTFFTRIGSTPKTLSPEAFLAFWWMGLFGGLTAKRHYAISNAKTVGLLDLGTLAKGMMAKSSGAKSATVYRSKSGRKAYKGTRFLKSTGSWA